MLFQSLQVRKEADLLGQKASVVLLMHNAQMFVVFIGIVFIAV